MTTPKDPTRSGADAGDGPGGDASRPRPITIDRVRHLLKSTRYTGETRQAKAAAPARERPASAEGPQPAAQPKATSQPRPAPNRPAQPLRRVAAPAQPSVPARRSAAKAAPAPAPDASETSEAPEPSRPKRPMPPLRSDARSESVWFATQPEIQRLRQDHGRAVAGWGEAEDAEAGAGQDPEAGETDGPPETPPRSFADVDHESWFAHQPEVRRLILDREQPDTDYFAESMGAASVADETARREPPPPPLPPSRTPPPLPPSRTPPSAPPVPVAVPVPAPIPRPGTARRESVHQDEFPDYFEVRGGRIIAGESDAEAGQGGPGPFADADIAHSPYYGDAGPPSPWFAEQPEFQRLHGYEEPQRASGGGVFRLSFVLVGCAALAVFLWFADWRALGDMVDLDGLTGAVARILGGGEERQRVVVEPTVVNAPSAERSGEAAVSALRAPTAPGEPPADGAGVGPARAGVTVIAKLADAAPAADPAVPATGEAPAGAEPPPPLAPPDAAQESGGANQSIFMPSRPARLDPPDGGPRPDADPFSSFSSESGGRADPEAETAALDGGDIPGLDAVERGAAIQADEIDSYVAEARTLFLERDYAGSARLLRDVLATDPSNLAALKLYGDILMRERQLAPALEVFDAILAANPAETRAHLDRGTVLLALDRPNAAINAAEAALSLAPNTLAAVELRSKASAADGNMADAMADCEEVDRLSNSKSAGEWCRAAAQNQSGNNFVAVRMFISALNTGEQGFVRTKQVQVRDLGLYDGPVDGLSSQELIDAVTSCAVARDCVL